MFARMFVKRCVKYANLSSNFKHTFTTKLFVVDSSEKLYDSAFFDVSCLSEHNCHLNPLSSFCL